jgi:3-hydroxyacyl-CoA dehydrogenase
VTEIKQVAVLGSGVMGSGIAAVLANAGIPVLLLDMPAKEGPRNALAEGAIKKQSEGGTPGFAHKKYVKLVTAGNFEDDLAKLAECDWIVEVVVEKLEIKQEVYRKIDAVRKKGSIVSSNTSTLPLHVLISGMPQAFADDFLITHFFNPPRFMRLLEVAKSSNFAADRFAAFCDFADRVLGKGVVPVKDTPGFIANRIGVYWMTAGLTEALATGIRIEEADAIMGKPLGLPKTGMFGLYDLIGIDLMPLIAKAMLATLPKDDAFRTLYQLPEIVQKMIADGYTGRKGKGGFYRMNKEGGKKTLEAMNLKTGEYTPEKKAKLESIDAAKMGLAALFAHPDVGGQYARAVMLKTLHYAASLIPEISDDIHSVDAAMQMGYNWKYGPFQMIDKLAAQGKSGTEIFAGALQQAGMSVPPIIAQSLGKKLYEVQSGVRQQFSIGGKFAPVPIPDGSLMLEDIKLTQKPVHKNASAQVWDLGDGVACLELTSKQNADGKTALHFNNPALDVQAAKTILALPAYSLAKVEGLGALGMSAESQALIRDTQYTNSYKLTIAFNPGMQPPEGAFYSPAGFQCWSPAPGLLTILSTAEQIGVSKTPKQQITEQLEAFAKAHGSTAAAMFDFKNMNYNNPGNAGCYATPKPGQATALEGLNAELTAMAANGVGIAGTFMPLDGNVGFMECGVVSAKRSCDLLMSHAKAVGDTPHRATHKSWAPAIAAQRAANDNTQAAAAAR